MTHTPTPWDYFPNLPPASDDFAPLSFDIITNPGLDDMSVEGDFYRIAKTTDGGSTAEANAAFIVRAVNAHDDLVAALSDAQESFCRSYCDPDDKEAPHWGECDEMRAALAKARGE